MNELAYYLEEIADCPECGKPCVEEDNDGETIHDQCAIDREAARVDRLHEGGQMTEQIDRIEKAYYRTLGCGNVLEVTSNSDAHVTASVANGRTEFCWFNLSDADLVKLHDGIKDAMKQRGMLGPRGYSDGYGDGHRDGYSEGQRHAFRQVADAIDKAAL